MWKCGKLVLRLKNWVKWSWSDSFIPICITVYTRVHSVLSPESEIQRKHGILPFCILLSPYKETNIRSQWGKYRSRQWQRLWLGGSAHLTPLSS